MQKFCGLTVGWLSTIHPSGPNNRTFLIFVTASYCKNSAKKLYYIIYTYTHYELDILACYDYTINWDKPE